MSLLCKCSYCPDTVQLLHSGQGGDLPIIVQVQSMVEYMEVLQLQFIDRLVVSSVLYGDRVHSANCAEDRRFHGAVLDGRRHARCCAMTGVWFRQCKTAEFRSWQCSDKVVDVPAVAGHRQDVDLPVILQ